VGLNRLHSLAVPHSEERISLSAEDGFGRLVPSDGLLPAVAPSGSNEGTCLVSMAALPRHAGAALSSISGGGRE
jgi:hypothetical protein